jgi:Flp pilus assembly protein TadG
MRHLLAIPKRCAGDRRGSIPVVFAVSILPLLIAVGGGIDYGRAAQVRVDMQAAVDAAALAVGRAAIELGRTDNTVQARQAFDAGFKPTGGVEVIRFDVDQDAHRLAVDVEVRVPMMFGRILRMDDIVVGAKAEVPLDDMTVEVALVLDNTGSMGSQGRMTALKTAAKNLVTKLQNASVVNTNAFIAVVPFTTQVRLPFTLNAPPVGQTYDPVWKVPGVRLNHPDDAAEPVLQVAYPWYGCLADRNKPNDTEGYDAQGAPLTPNLPATLLPATNCWKPGGWTLAEPPLRPLLPLNREFDVLRAHIDSMHPAGNTNTSIGLAAGLGVLTPNVGTFSTNAKPPGRYVKKHMIFLTDGDNTQNRWTTDTALIDQQTQQMCNEIKQSSLNVVLHTVLLMEGNETLLRNCASTPQRFYLVTDPAQLNAVFDAIAAELLSIRLSY